MVSRSSSRPILFVRTLAGFCVIFDECAYWRDETSATPDIEVYNAILPGLTTLPGAMLIGISSRTDL
jgi:hypothetical protein